MADVYVVIHISTTCDEHGVYVTKDSAEIIELAWILVDAKSLEELTGESILVRPINTPITPLCTSLTTITWEHVRTAGTFKDAITRFDQFVHEHIIAKNLDFTFVTLNVKDLRVQIPREARDKSVVLPPYLQHSRVFDLRQEYSKWQTHHPESLSYSSSNLNNICTALEVELVQTRSNSANSIKTNSTTNPNTSNNLQFQIQALNQQQASSPALNPINAPSQQQHPQAKRAMEETVLLSRVLVNLVKKSVPIEDHPDVLTRPYDARADVRAFLSERSKILYLSNLPTDTTQSELESWFTQYGGRPIAFWTLKTSDQHKPTGSGFAVFSTHEEATESLAMNGRALNDKAVEVQPSSARVLDRAQDILTPFPPSKNRPRPGDWTCPSCGFSNFQRRTACFRCSFPAASAAAIQESMYSNTTNANGGNYMNNNSNNSNNNNNHNGNFNNAPLSGQAPSQLYNQHNSSAVSNNISSVSLNSAPSLSSNGNVSSVPFRAGDWKCGNENCSYHNFAKNICCLRCGAPRIQTNIMNGGGHHGGHHGHHNNHGQGLQPQPQQRGGNNGHMNMHPQLHHQQQQQLQQLVQQQLHHQNGSHDSINSFQNQQQQQMNGSQLNPQLGPSQHPPQQFYQGSGGSQPPPQQQQFNNYNHYDMNQDSLKAITGQINSLSLGNNGNNNSAATANSTGDSLPNLGGPGGIYYNGLNSLVNSSNTSLSNSIGGGNYSNPIQFNSGATNNLSPLTSLNYQQRQNSGPQSMLVSRIDSNNDKNDDKLKK